MKKLNELYLESQRKLYTSGDFSDAYESIFSWNRREINDKPFYEKIIKSYKVESALDLGCGNGFHLYLLKKFKQIKRLVGVDYSEKMLRITQKRLGERGIKNVKLVKASFYNISDSFKEKFDLIVWAFGLSAIPSEKQLIKSLIEARKLLSKKGILIIEDMNGDRIINLPPNFEHRPIDAESFDLVHRQNLIVKVIKGWRFPKISISKKVKVIEFGVPNLFEFMKQRNIYIKVYHNFDPYLVNDHIFVRQGFIKRFKIESYRTNCLLLPRAKLTKYLESAGFKKIKFYSGHRFQPYDHKSYSQLVLAQ